MTPDDVQALLSIMDKVLFLLQVLCISSTFLGGVSLLQLIIHTKNQKHIF